jgi:hypothetical protein
MLDVEEVFSVISQFHTLMMRIFADKIRPCQERLNLMVSQEKNICFQLVSMISMSSWLIPGFRESIKLENSPIEIWLMILKMNKDISFY